MIPNYYYFELSSHVISLHSNKTITWPHHALSVRTSQCLQIVYLIILFLISLQFWFFLLPTIVIVIKIITNEWIQFDLFLTWATFICLYFLTPTAFSNSQITFYKQSRPNHFILLSTHTHIHNTLSLINF